MSAPKGQVRERLAKLIADLRKGRMTPATQEVADALERIKDGKLESGELDAELGLRRGKGRPEKTSDLEALVALRRFTANDILGRLNPVCRFLFEKMEADRRFRGRRERAINAAAEKFDKDERTIERQWEKAEPLLEACSTLKAAGAMFPPMPPMMAAINKTMASAMRPLARVCQVLRPQLRNAQKALENIDFIRRYISDEELEGELGELSIPALFELAHIRERRRTTAK